MMGLCVISCGLTLMASRYISARPIALPVSRNHRLGTFTKRSRVPLWGRCCPGVYSQKRHRAPSEGSSARNGRLQAHVRQPDRYRVERTQLLLPVGLLLSYPRASHPSVDRCGNVASILELDENLRQEYKVFSHAPAVRTMSALLDVSPAQSIYSGREIHSCKAATTRIFLMSGEQPKVALVDRPTLPSPCLPRPSPYL